MSGKEGVWGISRMAQRGWIMKPGIAISASEHGDIVQDVLDELDRLAREGVTK